MSDGEGDDACYAPAYEQYNEDSVPPPEKEIQHTHPGRPDLDYDDTPVGPANGVVCDRGQGQEHHPPHHHKKHEEQEEEN